MNIRIARKIVLCKTSLSNNPDKVKIAKEVLLRTGVARRFDNHIPVTGKHKFENIYFLN